MSDRLDERYIGDGVYASHDGYQIWVRAERDGRQHEIALEPHVLAALFEYNAYLKAKFRGSP